MPRASDEQRERWSGPDEARAIEFLQSRGFVLGHDFYWRHPDPDVEPTRMEWDAMLFLVDEWDYGGFVTDKEEP